MHYHRPRRKPEDLGLDVSFDCIYHTALRSVVQLPNTLHN